MNRQKTIVRGSDRSCEYYPCHVEGQDCTWCYCPFYPCLDDKTGGRSKVSTRTGEGVWSCIDCGWIHDDEIASAVADAMNGANDDREELLAVRRRLLEGEK
ncbi:MAG: cysteine-rich small domain-containing protein [Candidatus Hydrothermarchaeaceae archaeon]